MSHHPEVGFAERLRARREELGLTQEDLAERLGVRQGQISAYETGKQKQPRAKRLMKMAEALGVSARWLTTGDPDVDDAAPTPDHWAEFLDRYEYINELNEDELAAMRTFAGRTHRISSWYDWAQLAEWLRNRKPLPAFEKVVEEDDA